MRDISTDIANIACCIANKTWQVANRNLSGVFDDSCDLKTVLMNRKLKVIKEFIPVGTVITPGYIIDATFDLNTLVDFPDPLYFGDFEVNSVVLANINDYFANLSDLIDALVTAIIAYGNNYSAVNNGDGTITITFPPNTVSATSEIDIVFYDTFQVFGTTFLGTTPNAGSTILAVAADGTCLAGLRDGLMYAYPDFQVTGELWGGSADFAAGFADDATYSPITDSFYVTDQSANKIYPIDTAGALGAAYLTPAGAIINSPSCIIYNPYSLSEDIYFTTPSGIGSTIPAYPNTGNQYPRRVLGKINGSGVIKPVDFYSNNSYDCFSMIASSWDGSIWMMPNTANNVNNPLSSNFGNPSIKVVQGIWNATETGVINMASSPGVTEVVIPIPEVTSQFIQTIAFYTGTDQATSRMIAMQSTSLIIINTTNFSKVTVNLDNTAGGLNILAASEVLNCVYYSNIFDVILVGTNQARIFVLRYTGDNLAWTQTIPLIIANVGAVRKFQDNEFSDSVSYIGGDTPGVETFFDQYGTITRSSIEYTFDDPEETTTPEVLQTAADNCNTEQQILDGVEQLKAECGCGDCGNNIQDSNNNNPPVITGNIYFGRSALIGLNESQVLALPSVQQSVFAGTYSYSALPLTYTYLFTPVSFGLPTSFVDPNTGFVFAVVLPLTTLLVNGVSYYQIRSFNLIGGAIDLQTS